MSFFEYAQTLPAADLKRAIAEAGRDREGFPKKFGFTKAIRWQLVVGEKHLDPRAVLAAAVAQQQDRTIEPGDGPRGLNGTQLQKIFKKHGYKVEDAVPRFDEIPGFPTGALFADRQEVSMAGVHRQPQGGITGGADGAESIVLNDGYEDDDDHGSFVIYTGEGKNDPSTGKQLAHQEWKKGNRGLQVSCDNGHPVRVVRGFKSHLGPETGYRYDGLFRVEWYWMESGKSGFRICRFRLRQLEPSHVSSAADETGEAFTDGGKPGRRTTIVQRIIRNSKTADKVKKVHKFQCQICGIRVETQGGPYAEGAHICPLGKPHNGPDSASNLLCLCPTCHVYLDKGSLVITDDFIVQDRTGTGLGGLGGRRLRLEKKHELDRDHIRYHRSIFPEQTK